MIKLKDITKIYGKGTGQEVHALKKINICIEQGDFVAIIGASGSGKSSLMNILGMLDRPTSGDYFLDHREMGTYKDSELAKLRNTKIGFVFQKFHLISKTTAIENVELPLIYSAKKNIRKLAFEALKQVGLDDRLSHKPNELSGGQQQRVAIARALVNKPDIILADEPTGNLDSKSSSEILDVFCELNKNGKTIILITHEQEIAEKANRVLKIHDGEIVEDYRN